MEPKIIQAKEPSFEGNFVNDAIQVASLNLIGKSKHMEIAKKWLLQDTVICSVGTNDNHFTFTYDELANSYQSLDGVPVLINMIGGSKDGDHAVGSSMNTVGWTHNPRFNGSDVVADLEVTNPEVGPRTERGEIKSVSMGAKTVPICSICGEDIRQCPHERGEQYDGNVCTAVGTNTVFDHVALTNFNADQKANIGKVIVSASSLTKNFKEVSNLADGIGGLGGNAMAPPMNTAVSMDDLLMRLEALEAKLAETPGAAEMADVAEGNALTPQEKKPVTEGEAGVPEGKKAAINVEVKPKAPVAEGSQEEDDKEKEKETSQDEIETPEDEEKEKKKELEKVTAQVKELQGEVIGNLSRELAVKTKRDSKEFAGKSIIELKAMLEVAQDMPNYSGLVSEYASMNPASERVRKTGIEAAVERAEKFGSAEALEMAYNQTKKSYQRIGKYMA